MSRGGSRGMPENVQRALGYAADGPRRMIETAKCTCGAVLEFKTDYELRRPNAFGRIFEVCPRGCKRSTPNGAADLAKANERLLDQARAENGVPKTQNEYYLERDFGQTTCARGACAKEFTKRSKTQRYCSRICVDLTSHERKTGLRAPKR